MTQDEIIRMALEVGVKEYGPLTRNWSFGLSQLERFAALVAAHEREKLLNKLEGVSEKVIYETVKEAVLAERETCAKSVYDSTDWAHEERDMVLKEAIAAAIRARGRVISD